MTFYDCLMECVGNRELVKGFDRLRGTNLSMSGPPINLMVDEATGKQREDMNKFIEFCWDCVWTRLTKRDGNPHHEQENNGDKNKNC